MIGYRSPCKASRELVDHDHWEAPYEKFVLDHVKTIRRVVPSFRTAQVALLREVPGMRFDFFAPAITGTPLVESKLSGFIQVSSTPAHVTRLTGV